VNVAFWIAGRYLRTRRPTAFIALLTGISVAGVTVGVAALIAVLAVMNGFEEELRTRIAGTNAHSIVLSFDDAGIADTSHALSTIRQHRDVVGAAPFIYRKALLSHDNLAEGLVIKGVDLEAEQQVTTVASHITPELTGIPDTTESGVPGIVLGNELADNVRARVGDRVVVASLQGGVQSALGLVPKLATFEVVGIFRSGLYEYDANLAYVSLAAAGRLFNTKGAITGIEVKGKDLFQAPRLSRELVYMLQGYPYRATDWIEMNQNLFAFMKVEKTVMGLILGLIVVVAALNIISTLLMVVLAKRRDIGSLMAQGASPGDIRRVFLIEGSLIGGLGTALGIALGITICRLLDGFKIPADVYFLAKLPVRMQWEDVLVISVVAILLCVAAALYPATYAARIPPAEAVREV
jgi:lipoprotein-releasing system permease protein